MTKLTEARKNLTEVVRNSGMSSTVKRFANDVAHRDKYLDDKLAELVEGVSEREDTTIYLAAKEFVTAYEEAQA